MADPVTSTAQRRESIAAALYARVDASARRVVNLQTSSRRLRTFDQVPGEEMPALFQTQRPETYERGTHGLPGKRTLHFEMWMMVSDPQEDSVIPAQQLNNMVDAVEAALAPDSPVTGLCTLGNQVADARIDGSVEYYEGVTQDGKSIAIVPVAVLMP